MRYSEVAALAALVASGMAQTPPGFEPAVEANLAVIFEAGAVEEPGTSFTIEGKAPTCHHEIPYLMAHNCRDRGAAYDRN